MRKEYDFTKGKRNPYARQLKQSITIRVDRATLEYFKHLAAELEVPYQTLINSYLPRLRNYRAPPRHDLAAISIRCFMTNAELDGVSLEARFARIYLTRSQVSWGVYCVMLQPAMSASYVTIAP